MTQFSIAQFSLDRRSLLKSTGALVISIGLPGGFAAAAPGAAIKPPPSPDQLDSWLAIKADGDVVAYFGKMDMGHGLQTAIGQMVAEELDVPFKAVTVFLADTATSVNQGGASGSTGIQEGGKQMRMAAAEARRVLVEMAAERLSVPADQLTVVDGVVRSKTDAADNDPNMPDALEAARALDEEFARTGRLKGPLHGIVFAIKDQFDTLYREGAENGRVMCLSLHPHNIGRPNAAKHLDEALRYILGHDGVWNTTADDIAEYYIVNYYDQVSSWIAEHKQ